MSDRMRCVWCGADLVGPVGQPRWEIVTLRLVGAWIDKARTTRAPAEHAYVCLERCPPPTRRIAAAYAVRLDAVTYEVEGGRKVVELERSGTLLTGAGRG